MLRTTRGRRNLRVQSGSNVDDREEIELKILNWLEHPDAELERVMDLVSLGHGAFGSSREDRRLPKSCIRADGNSTRQPPPQTEQKHG